MVCCTSRRSDNNPSVVIWLRRVKVAVCSMLSKGYGGKEKRFLDNKYFIQLKKYIKKKTCQMRESDEKKKQELAEKKTKKKKHQIGIVRDVSKGRYLFVGTQAAYKDPFTIFTYKGFISF